ncbi:hypothetical protein ACLI1A_13440 [Flavobacterium sp. RHBU_3]|uniref:hypothetical protein n=1 Tax=Flavobacterium sp. RHBU_3 TaxID=3391184 RepID=UPI0039856648
MRKLLYMMLLVYSITNAQNAPFTTANNLKITNPVEGNATDSVLVWRSIDKAVRFFPLGGKYVPYKGATRDVDLGNKGLYANRGYFADNHTPATGFNNIFSVAASSDTLTDSKGLYIVKDQYGQLHINNRGKGNIETNSAFGIYSLVNNITGYANTSFGYASLYSNTTGVYNTAIGLNSMISGNGNYNTGIGALTLQNVTSQFNTAVGYQALTSLTSGASNTAVGLQTLSSLNTGTFNTAFGGTAMYSTTTGSYNTCFGSFCGRDITEGNYNTLIGRSIGRPLTTGSYNLIVSRGTNDTTEYSGISTGSYNTLLGTVKSMAANSNNWVVLADGTGSRAFEKNGSTGAVDIKGTSFTFNSGGLKAGIMNIISTATVTAANIGSNGLLYIYADASAGNITINLPTATSLSGYSVWVYRKDSTSNTVTIDANGSELINQSLTYSLSGQNSNAKFTSDGTQIRVFN